MGWDGWEWGFGRSEGVRGRGGWEGEGWEGRDGMGWE